MTRFAERPWTQGVSFTEMLAKAVAERVAVAAFNVYDLASVRAALTVAQQTGQPILLALGERYFKNLRPVGVVGLLNGLLESPTMGAPLSPLGLHLDHALAYESCVEAVTAGFSSVMIDASQFDFAENVRQTRAVVERAHAHGVGVEAELGGLAAGMASHEFVSGQELLTDPDQAAEFVAQTGVDALAVSVGTVHGLYKGEPHLDLERLDAIQHRVSIPLVLHGGSGTPADLLHAAIRRGVAKVNVNTEVSLAAVGAIAATLRDHPQVHMAELDQQAQAAMESTMARYVQLFHPATAH
ncbi:class II fructose-bisphosphate aldolase [Alicyclobacillaceae bacterium I2511]|nr:class II fructose-bisphosphate aldolase [Alicyclobacillaceae bacterium I2511]